jgi:hypothetical protein
MTYHDMTSTRNDMSEILCYVFYTLFSYSTSFSSSRCSWHGILEFTKCITVHVLLFKWLTLHAVHTMYCTLLTRRNRFLECDNLLVSSGWFRYIKVHCKRYNYKTECFKALRNTTLRYKTVRFKTAKRYKMLRGLKRYISKRYSYKRYLWQNGIVLQNGT